MEQGWRERLRDDDIVLVDGGTGSELRRRGVKLSPAAWSGPAVRDNAAVLRQIHADFIRAGADVITTNTFATVRFVLRSAGLAEEFVPINRLAVDAALAARDAAADRPIAIAGSMSCLPPRFDPAGYPPRDRERDDYRELAELLADSGVDLIALEMLQDVEHGQLAMEAALETGLPVWLGVSGRVVGGQVVAYDAPACRLAPVIEALTTLQPAVVNVMHTPLAAVPATLQEVRRHWRGPLGAYPELGEGHSGLAAGGDAETPAELVEAAMAWVGLGARLLGGCCGSGPEHIAALAAARARLLTARHGP